MGSLADLTAAGRTDILPGYQLSPLSLKDFGVIERELESQRIAEVQVMVEGLPSNLAGVAAPLLLRGVQEDIAKGKYSFGRPLYNAFILSAKAGGLVLSLSIRHARPAFTRPEAEALADTPEAEAARNAILDMSGYKPVEQETETRDRPLNWHNLYENLEKLGVSRADIGDMTLDQVQGKLGINAPQEPPKKSPQQKASERIGIFDAICEKHGLTPDQLKAERPERVAELVKGEGFPVVEVAAMPQWVDEYARVKAA